MFILSLVGEFSCEMARHHKNLFQFTLLHTCQIPCENPPKSRIHPAHLFRFGRQLTCSEGLKPPKHDAGSSNSPESEVFIASALFY